MDSAEGIAHFWVRADRDRVAQSLEDLCARGILDRRTIGGTDFYSLNKSQSSPALGVSPARHSTLAAASARVLVVDNDAAVLKLLTGVLRGAGYEVTGAAGGGDALNYFRANPFDVVITDLRLGGISGLHLLQAVRQSSPTTEVVVVTGHATLDTAIEALHQGAYDLVPKPLRDTDSFTRIVGRAAERRRLTLENRRLVEDLHARNTRLKETVARLAAVSDVGRATSGQLDETQMYQSLAQLTAQHLEARRVSVLMSDPGSDTLRVVASVGVPERVADIDRTDSFLISPLSVWCTILKDQRRVGVITASDKHSGDPFTEQDLEFLSLVSQEVGTAIDHARRFRAMNEGYLGSLASLIEAAEERAPGRRGHSRRVTELAAAVGAEMGLAAPRLDLLVKAAALHEIGRILSQASVGGSGDRAPEAFGGWEPAAIMAADRTLAPIPSLREVREIIFRAGDCLRTATPKLPAGVPSAPIESRILAICEEFERLLETVSSSTRPRAAALEALRNQPGPPQGPEIVAALSRLVAQEGQP